MDAQIDRVQANGITINVATAGQGPPILLLHGFPHTWRVWSAVMPELARSRRVIAPDLRGLGESSRAADGYDVLNLARDVEALLDALEVDAADAVGIDAGAPPVFAFAMRSPARVPRLVIMESTLGQLPGAESFFAGGPPWWFGFHMVDGLAERVLVGHEAEYVDWFYRTGTYDGQGVADDVRDAMARCYEGSESLRAAFEHYRAMPTTANQIAELVRGARLTVPTLAVGAQPVGDTLARQLRGITDDLTEELVPRCGHIIPLDAPEALLRLLSDFLA